MVLNGISSKQCEVISGVSQAEADLGFAKQREGLTQGINLSCECVCEAHLLACEHAKHARTRGSGGMPSPGK